MATLRLWLILAVLLPTVALAQSDSTRQPAGMIAALEYTDIAKTPAGDGTLGRKAWLGVYYSFSESLTGIAVAAYGQNDLNDGGEVTMREAKATITLDLLEWRGKFAGAFFVIGAVGKSWTEFSESSEGMLSSFLGSTGFGIKFHVKPAVVAAHLRLDKSEEYQQVVLGIDYALPFDIK